MNVIRRATAGAAALLLFAVVAPQVASAHARYKSSTPGASEVVQTSPAQVEITFTEEIQKVSGKYGMTVTDSSNAVVSSGPAVVNDTDRTKMSVPLAPNLPAGRYVVNWNNVSDADGDPLSGAFAFYVGVQPTAAEAAADNALATASAPEPESTGTAATGAATPAATSAAPATTGPEIGPATAVASPTATGGGSSGGSSNTGLYIGLGVVVAAVLVAGGGYLVYRNRGRA